MTRKNTFPAIAAGGGIGKKIIGALIVVALLAAIVRYPAEAAGWVKDAAAGAVGVVDGLASFFQRLG